MYVAAGVQFAVKSITDYSPFVRACSLISVKCDLRAGKMTTDGQLSGSEATIDSSRSGAIESLKVVRRRPSLAAGVLILLGREHDHLAE